MRQPLTILATAVAIASPATAQDSQRPNFWDAFTVEAIGTIALHSVMSWARLLADIRYDQVSVDPVALKVTLTGVRISPYLPDRPDGQCQLRVERLTMNGQPIDVRDTRRMRVALDGVAMEAGCLPFEAAGMLRGLGFPQLTAGRIEADLTYDYPSGGLFARVSADIDRLATVDADVDLDYVSYRMDFARENPEPRGAVDLNSVVVAIQDRGAWDIARKFIMPGQVNPEELAPVVGAGIEAALEDANGPGVAATEKQRAFARSAGAVTASFLTSGRQVVVATAIEKAPLRIDLTQEPAFAALFDALNPTVSHSQPQLASAVSVAELDAAMKAETPPENAFEIGRALITGIGAPKNPNGGSACCCRWRAAAIPRPISLSRPKSPLTIRSMPTATPCAPRPAAFPAALPCSTGSSVTCPSPRSSSCRAACWATRKMRSTATLPRCAVLRASSLVGRGGHGPGSPLITGPRWRRPPAMRRAPPCGTRSARSCACAVMRKVGPRRPTVSTTVCCATGSPRTFPAGCAEPRAVGANSQRAS
ncbi:hypothetical protein ACFSZS_19420 [Seohaeicola zhoushanensis]